MEQAHKHSRKREAILDCVRSTRTHPTAEWIYAKLKPRIPDLSLGTVYRNMALFKEEGLVISIGTVNGQERFDGTTEPHSHFVCRGCGSVLDLPTAALPETLDTALKDIGCHAEQTELRIFGLCPNCSESK